MAKRKGQYAKVVATVGDIEVPVLHLRNWSISTSAEEIDTTTAGSEWKEFESGFKEWEGDAETVDADTFYIQYLGEKATVKFYVNENDTKYLEGDALILGIDKSSPYDDLVEQSLNFKGTGPLTEK